MVVEMYEEDDLAKFKVHLASDKCAGKLVVVDFFADWCGPCRRIAPLLKTLSEEVDYLLVIKINVDSCGSLASGMGINSMPTFKFYKNGEEVDELIGASETELKQKVTKNKP